MLTAVPRQRLPSCHAGGATTATQVRFITGEIVSQGAPAILAGMEFARPTDPCGTGVLVLAGSSGRVDQQRVNLLARHGALAVSMQWFGGPGMSPGPWEVPIESFVKALDALAAEVDRLAILGVSFGAEAALVTGALDERVERVAAFAPSSVVWAAYDEVNQRPTSKWTFQGELLPCLPIVRPSGPRPAGPPSYLATYEHSLAAATADELERATIPVERISETLLVSGGDDRVWPSGTFAKAIIERRTKYGLDTQHVTLAEAGHRTLLPGEEPPESGKNMLRGGTPKTDAMLGALAWPHVSNLLKLRESALGIESPRRRDAASSTTVSLKEPHDVCGS